jgi:hypothetical protein
MNAVRLQALHIPNTRGEKEGKKRERVVRY